MVFVVLFLLFQLINLGIQILSIQWGSNLNQAELLKHCHVKKEYILILDLLCLLVTIFARLSSSLLSKLFCSSGFAKFSTANALIDFLLVLCYKASFLCLSGKFVSIDL